MKELLVGLNSQTMREAEGFTRIEPDTNVIGEISTELQTSVYGQDKAMESLARAIVRSRAGFSDPRRPEMVAMFAGPTGVGKTEAGKALAKFLYPKDWQERVLRIDCTNLSEDHNVASLKGSDPGYIGYGDSNILITPEFLNRGGVIILDEFEKAAPKVKKWFLPVFEEGQQKALVPKQEGTAKWSSEQQTLDFSNTHIILTANCGAEALHKARTGHTLGFTQREVKPDMEKIGIAEVRKSFASMPELLGRIDSIIVFNELERPEYVRIFNKFMDEINQEQRYGHNFLAVTNELRNFVLDHAETGEYGAREIRHKLNTYVVDKAAEIKYSGVLPDMSALIGDVEDDEVIFWTSKVELEKPVNKTPILPEIHDFDEPIEPDEEIDEDLPIKSQRDAGSYIGNKEKSRKKRRKQEESDDDIRGPKDEYDVNVTYEDGSTDSITGLDKFVSDIVLQGFGEIPEHNGRRIVSASSRLREPENKSLSFVIPFEGVIFDSMDLAITIRAGGHEYLQILEGLPIVKTK